MERGEGKVKIKHLSRSLIVFCGNGVVVMCCDEFADTPVYPWKIYVMQTKKVSFIKGIEKPLTF